MKNIFIAFWLLSYSLLLAENPKFKTLTTTEGKTYKNVTVSKSTPAGISIIHESGAASIPFEKLPIKIQRQFNYDPLEAQEHRQKEAEARRKFQEARNKIAIENGKIRARMAQEEADKKRKEAGFQKFYEEMKRKSGKLVAPARIVTEKEIKAYWLYSFPQPKSLDRDYHQKKKDYKKLITNINAGKYDYVAKVKAMEWNIKEYQRTENLKMANQVRADLNLIKEEESATRSREESEYSLFRLEQQLRNINFELQRR